MSIHLINKYYSEVEKIKRFGGSSKETAIRNAFYQLLNDYAKQKDLFLIPELDYRTVAGKTVRPDGTLKDALRLDWGYWESKDSSDDLDKEIEKKFKLGYPNSNILFEDGVRAVLYQKGQTVHECKVSDDANLDRLLNEFISYTRPEIKHFREALELFKKDIPQVLETLRLMINEQAKANPQFLKAQADFLALCRETINPQVSPEDVNEMLIQHILTEEIFTSVFEDPQFHQENNISKELHKLEDTFFTGSVKRNTLDSIKPYYAAIKAQAGAIANYSEKQMFLKSIYENFYKVYNPKAADRLGVVYTPNEIVNFMIEGTDYLLHKHFNKLLSSKNVEILDPATGTGTFITDIINYLPPNELPYKYKNEIHCNEISLLPYYIANLNIESTFKQKMGYYEEFKNICFVDTLDNMEFTNLGLQLGIYSLSQENTDRVKRQNAKKISVIIGNPPYNANQHNENDNNKNRSYTIIDQRIKDTFVKFGTAQKTKVYDPYSRFYRWAMDRLGNDGIIAFISNNSFVKGDGFDGFRYSVFKEFSSVYVIDLCGDLRTDKESNIFGITVGVCIAFMIKNRSIKLPCEIFYHRVPNVSVEEKLAYLSSATLDEIAFERIEPSNKNQWLEIPNNDFEDFVPLVIKGRGRSLIFEHSNGVSTNRDEWAYDFSENNLIEKNKFFLEEYNKEVQRWIEYKEENDYVDIKDESNPVLDGFLHSRNQIKWSKMIKRDKLRKGKIGKFEFDDIRKCLYRPFVIKDLYFGYIPIDMKGAFTSFYPEKDSKNFTISITNSERVLFSLIASDSIADLNIFSPAPVFSFSQFTYDKNGNRIDNITDWGLQQFTDHYNGLFISKEDIFHYSYAVLHYPAYRKKYELNLNREFPRIPFYENFRQWVAWGKELMDLHINFEKAKPYPLKRVSASAKASADKGKQGKLLDVKLAGQLVNEPVLEYNTPKAKLKADKEAGVIILDEVTSLTGIPKQAWEYKLGNRSALEWILDQYKEKKPSDPTIAEKFNTYRFADYKEKVIDLLQRVCTVSVETVRIVVEMDKIKS